MNPPSNKTWLNFSIAAISGMASFLVTFVTIIGFGWKVHREIMNDVATLQAQSIAILEKTLGEKINAKLDREPSNYQLQAQENELKAVKMEVQNTNLKIGNIENQLKEIKNLVTEKQQ